MTWDPALIDRCEAYVTAVFRERTDPALVYHNLDHTRSVVNRCYEIGNFYQLNATDQEVLLVAAWFHDIGQTDGPAKGHEDRSMHHARLFLLAEGASGSFRDAVAACIMATSYPPHPLQELHRIICDADTYHLGTPEFIKADSQVWEEVERREAITIHDKTFKSLQFLSGHQFFTGYCRERLGAGKVANLELLRARLVRELN